MHSKRVAAGRRVVIGQDLSTWTVVYNGGRPVRLVPMRPPHARQRYPLPGSPYEHECLFRRGDRVDPDADPVMGDSGEGPEGGESPEIVAPGLVGQRNDPRPAVPWAAGRVEGDMPVTGARSQNEQVDPPGAGDSRVIRRRVRRVGKPDRLAADAVRRRQCVIQTAGDLDPREVVTAPGMRG